MRIEQTHNIDPTAKPGKPAHSPEAVNAAREFEALFASFMMRAMRKTVGDGGLVPNSLGERIYTDMLDGEYSKLLAKDGTLGLAEMILDQIEPDGAGESSLSALRGLNHSPWMIDQRLVPQNRFGTSLPLPERLAKYNDIIDEASAKFGVDRDLITAVIAQESAGNPYAVSHAGAKGLMQLIDSTAREMGVRSVFDPRDNILGGTRYLRDMLERHGGDERLALASYNAGPAAVEQHNGIPPYAETRNYVERVLQLRDTLAQDAGKENEQ
jgi:Rod binding domain-containing protein